MCYRILILNRISLKGFEKEALYQHLLSVNFETLCDQYQLDSTQIAPAKSNVEVLVSKERNLAYFLVNYGPNHHPPIVVTEWDIKERIGNNSQEDFFLSENNEEIPDQIFQANFIVEIELIQSQLRDMGLLLAYEIARWAAGRGEGVVLGLDNIWYRLNQHRAFVPINEKNCD